jgi:hypothetical protein
MRLWESLVGEAENGERPVCPRFVPRFVVPGLSPAAHLSDEVILNPYLDRDLRLEFRVLHDVVGLVRLIEGEMFI